MEEIYSFSEEVDLSWIKILVIGYVVFIIGIIVVNSIDNREGIGVNKIDSYKGSLRIETSKKN